MALFFVCAAGRRISWTKSITVNGATCAVGALGIAAGFDVTRMLKAPRSNDCKVNYASKGTLLYKMIQAIKKEFGLSEEELQNIQARNDNFSNPETRREAILEYIAELE